MECSGYASVEADESLSAQCSAELRLIGNLLSINRQLKAFANQACGEALTDEGKLSLLQDIGHAAKYLHRAAIRLASNVEPEDG